MTPEMQAELLKRLDALTAKLGITAEQLWAILVRQARIEAVVGIICLLFSLLAVAGLAYWWVNALRRNRGEFPYDANAFEVVALGGSSLVVGIFATASIVNAFGLPGLLLNPEYWAFREVMRLVR